LHGVPAFQQVSTRGQGGGALRWHQD